MRAAPAVSSLAGTNGTSTTRESGAMPVLPKSAMLGAVLVLAAGAAEAQVSFLDHRGVLIELETPAQRLVSIIRSAPVVYYSVDTTAAHQVGMNADTQGTLSSTIYGELLPDLLKLDVSPAREGFAPNVEAILALNPDLVVQWTFDPEIIEPLERVGLKVMGWDCCTEQQRRDYLTLSGYASGRIDRAQTLLKLQDDSIAALRERFKETAPADYTTMLEIDQLNDQIQVVANSSQDYGLSAVRNLAADDSGEWWRTVDVEQILAWNPEIIIIPAWAAELSPADFYANDLLASVDAIKNHRVYKVPVFNRSPDYAEVYMTAEWLAAIAHPGTEAPSVRTSVADGYRTIYGVELTDAQLNTILEVDANKDSADYAALFD
jgi:iron complex transport system substrate-binding protein